MALEGFSGKQPALGALALVLLVKPVLFDGLLAFMVAPPPSAAFLYQDMAHSASLISGIVALAALRRSVGWGRWGWPSWVVLGRRSLVAPLVPRCSSRYHSETLHLAAFLTEGVIRHECRKTQLLDRFLELRFPM